MASRAKGAATPPAPAGRDFGGGPVALFRALRAARRSGRRLALIDMQGGLGNQLFCFAFGRHLEARGFLAVQEIRRLQAGGNDERRTYRLERLAVNTLVLPRNRLWRGWLWRVAGLRLEGERAPFSFCEYEATAHRLFSGYWQHAGYAAAALDEIRAAIAGVRVEHAMVERPGIVVGARRGDFLTMTAGESAWALSVEYHVAALRRAPAGWPVWIFSDDAAWAGAVLRPQLQAIWSAPVEVVSGIEGDWEALAAMTRGVFHVIPNSTFHWWGAALNAASCGCIAPAPWLRTESGRCGILPVGWETERARFE